MVPYARNMIEIHSPVTGVTNKAVGTDAIPKTVASAAKPTP